MVSTTPTSTSGLRSIIGIGRAQVVRVVPSPLFQLAAALAILNRMKDYMTAHLQWSEAEKPMVVEAVLRSQQTRMGRGAVAERRLLPPFSRRRRVCGRWLLREG